jgi:hypothetical protein
VLGTKVLFEFTKKCSNLQKNVRIYKKMFEFTKKCSNLQSFVLIQNISIEFIKMLLAFSIIK